MNNFKKKEDRDLIKRSKFDPAAYGELYQRYAGVIYRFLLRRLGGNQEVAKDLTQETFARAFDHRNRFVYRGHNYGAYLFTVARRLLANYYRKPKTVSLDDMERQFASPFSTEDGYMRREVWEALNTLPAIDRQVLLMKYRQGYSVRYIARVINKSENAVKLILSRAREKVRRSLGLRSRRKSH